MESGSPAAFVDGIVQVGFEVFGVVSRVAARHDLSLTQFRVLAILRDREPAMSELAAFLGLDRSTISGLVDRAAARGLVRRIVNEADRRSARVALTEEGRELAAIGAQEIAAALQPITAGFASAEGEQFTGLLDRAVRLLHPVSGAR